MNIVMETKSLSFTLKVIMNEMYFSLILNLDGNIVGNVVTLGHFEKEEVWTESKLQEELVSVGII